MSLELQTYISVFIRFIASMILVFFVLPKVWEETKVGNGLGRLRRIIFLGFIVFLGVNIFVMGANFSRAIHLVDETGTVGIISIINSLGQLILSFVLYIIYNEDYGRNEHKT